MVFALLDVLPGSPGFLALGCAVVGGHGKAGVCIASDLFVSWDSGCMITLAPCFNAKVKSWAFVKWNLLGASREQAFGSEQGGSACAQPLVLRRISK